MGGGGGSSDRIERGVSREFFERVSVAVSREFFKIQLKIIMGG